MKALLGCYQAWARTCSARLHRLQSGRPHRRPSGRSVQWQGAFPVSSARAGQRFPQRAQGSPPDVLGGGGVGVLAGSSPPLRAEDICSPCRTLNKPCYPVLKMLSCCPPPTTTSPGTPPPLCHLQSLCQICFPLFAQMDITEVATSDSATSLVANRFFF